MGFFRAADCMRNKARPATRPGCSTPKMLLSVTFLVSLPFSLASSRFGSPTPVPTRFAKLPGDIAKSASTTQHSMTVADASDLNDLYRKEGGGMPDTLAFLLMEHQRIASRPNEKIVECARFLPFRFLTTLEKLDPVAVANNDWLQSFRGSVFWKGIGAWYSSTGYKIDNDKALVKAIPFILLSDGSKWNAEARASFLVSTVERVQPKGLLEYWKKQDADKQLRYYLRSVRDGSDFVIRQPLIFAGCVEHDYDYPTAFKNHLKSLDKAGTIPRHLYDLLLGLPFKTVKDILQRALGGMTGTILYDGKEAWEKMEGRLFREGIPKREVSAGSSYFTYARLSKYVKGAVDVPTQCRDLYDAAIKEIVEDRLQTPYKEWTKLDPKPSGAFDESLFWQLIGFLEEKEENQEYGRLFGRLILANSKGTRGDFKELAVKVLAVLKQAAGREHCKKTAALIAKMEAL